MDKYIDMYICMYDCWDGHALLCASDILCVPHLSIKILGVWVVWGGVVSEKGGTDLYTYIYIYIYI